MLDVNEFGKILESNNFNIFSGVPCSFLAPLINYAINKNTFINANNEGCAVAFASGVSLSAKQTGVVLMQNSGLANAISPLTSLNWTFKIPILGFVSLRGEIGLNDEPQHKLMGQITDKLLALCDIKYSFLSDDYNIAKKQVEEAKEAIARGETYFFIVRKDTFHPLALKPKILESKKDSSIATQTSQILESKKGRSILNLPNDIKSTSNVNPKALLNDLPTRLEALTIINKLNNNNLVVFCTTGKSARELYEIKDCPNYLYMVGSMGCVGPFALGFSNMVDKKVIAIDGDGALLMRMGNLALNAKYQKNNFCHILLDNQTHDSTGGQESLSSQCNWENIAFDFGYKRVFYVMNLAEFEASLKDFINGDFSCFIYLRVLKGSKKNLGRPKESPSDIKLRLQKFLKDNI